MTAGHLIRRGMLAVLLPAALVTTVVSSASAGDCNVDISGLSKARQSYIDKLNVLAQATKGKLDPVASCTPLQGLVKSESALLKYLEANSTWCNIPDDTIAGLKAGTAKSVKFATQACGFAAQMKKQQAQQQANGAGALPPAQKLPAGPL